MKTEEDEAFEELERRQGGGFPAKRQMAADKMQEPVSFPCCGYTDATAIKWNQFNGVVQCYMCGQVYTAPPLPVQPVQREWVGLTPEETSGFTSQEITVAKYVSKVLQEKNT